MGRIAAKVLALSLVVKVLQVILAPVAKVLQVILVPVTISAKRKAQAQAQAQREAAVFPPLHLHR